MDEQEPTRLDHPAGTVRRCTWCPGGEPLVRYHPDGQPEHRPAAGLPDADSTASSGARVRAIAPTSDRPLDPHERASIARLLEAAVEALGNERATSRDRIQLLAGYLRSVADSAALIVRQGHRAHLLDKLAADLDAFVVSLDKPGEPS